MDFDLYPAITLRSRSFRSLVAPRELFIQALNRNLNLQRFRVLYVTGNYSGILSCLDRRFEALEVLGDPNLLIIKKARRYGLEPHQPQRLFQADGLLAL